MTILDGFDTARFETNGQSIAYAHAGTGPPVLLLHGFPQTHAMWHAIAPDLARDHAVIAPDLRGYGDSSKPADVAQMSFRAMASDPLALMDSLGHARFHVIGHDRGARTAFRMALDAPERVLSMTLMDIVPTYHLLNTLPYTVARDYYHWFFLAQPNPGPERMIGADADAFYESCLAGWGGAGLDAFDASALAEYRRAWRMPDTIRSMCNDYRAAIEIDVLDDANDLGNPVETPVLILFGESGVMAQRYDVPDVWSRHLSRMQAQSVPGGHFFPDTDPATTLKALQHFLRSAR